VAACVISCWRGKISIAMDVEAAFSGDSKDFSSDRNSIIGTFREVDKTGIGDPTVISRTAGCSS